MGSALLLDSGDMTTIERRLALHVGPIARYLLRSAVRQSDCVEALCRTLAANIENPAGRERFEEEMQVQLAHSLTRAGSRTGGAGLRSAQSKAELARAQKELTRFVGPIARVLVERGAPGCANLPRLWQQLAQHIDGAADRAAFLKVL